MKPPGAPTARAAKRLLDMILSTSLLLLLSPVMAVISVAIKATSPGPVLFRQERVGQGEKSFLLYKFRTMQNVNCDDEHRAFVTAQLKGEDGGSSEDGTFKLNDPRVTRVGAFLRRYSLDELPQLANVLNGSMSLVGPRPSLEWEIELFSDHHRARAAAVPGCSGLWQTSGRNRLSNIEMLELDLDYVDNWTLRRDLTILARTPLAILRGDGAR